MELFEVVQTLRYGPGDVVSDQSQSPEVGKFPDLFWNWPDQGVPADGERGFTGMSENRAVSSHGGRVALTRAGVPDSAIMRQGRWYSSTMVGSIPVGAESYAKVAIGALATGIRR